MQLKWLRRRLRRNKRRSSRDWCCDGKDLRRLSAGCDGCNGCDGCDGAGKNLKRLGRRDRGTHRHDRRVNFLKKKQLAR
jgi:hypothetical protein